MMCPVCNTEIPVLVKAFPHDHDVNGIRVHTKDFHVLVPHRFAKDPGLDQCEGSKYIFEIA